MGVPYEATEIHGLTNEDLVDAPPLIEVIVDLKKFVGDSILVAYNARFERKFLSAAAMMANVAFDNDFICAYQLSKLMVPGLDSDLHPTSPTSLK